jgi:uncharacterized protein YndB with AHSA1/START domain
MDVRPGGRWRFLCRNEDGSESAFSGTYREVVPPERLTWTIEFEPGPGSVHVEAMTLEDLGQRTRLIITARFETSEDRDGWMGAGMEGGRNETFERLDELLARDA